MVFAWLYIRPATQATYLLHSVILANAGILPPLLHAISASTILTAAALHPRCHPERAKDLLGVALSSLRQNKGILRFAV